MDLYGLILETLATDPPFVSIAAGKLYERIQGLVSDENKPSQNMLRNYLKSIRDILDSRNRSYEVLEWKDDSIYIRITFLILFAMEKVSCF